MRTETMARAGFALEAAWGVILAAALWWLWPLTGLPRLGREEAWFALAWLVLLSGPAVLGPRPALMAGGWLGGSLRARACQQGAILLGLVFLALLMAGRELGNYKLWLGAVYLAAVNLRLAGLSLGLGREEAFSPRQELKTAACLAGLATLAGLLLAPWVRPDLVAAWPPSAAPLTRLLAAALLWGVFSGSAFLLVRFWGGGRRTAWLTFLALGLGPGPALAVSWAPLMHLALAPLGLALLALPRLLRPRPAETGPDPDSLTLYWLLRALMLLWWGLGGALTLALAWWRPEVMAVFKQSTWLRAAGLGAFLVICLGLLVEYSLPLLGRQEWADPRPERRGLGVLLSVAALLAALSPLSLLPPPKTFAEGREMLGMSRAELMPAPQHLSPSNPEITLKCPSWLNNVSRVMVVSLLTNGGEVKQYEAVAQLVALDDQGIPHVFNLRAGVDTAEWALAKRDVALAAHHSPAMVADTWLIYSPTGEAFAAQSYASGLFMGSAVQRLVSVTLRYIYQNPEGRPPVSLEVRRVAVN